jgi:hypothetical protein
MRNSGSTISNPQLDALGFAIAPIAALSANAIERWWLGGRAFGALGPVVWLPLHDYLLKRNTQWWVYLTGAGAMAALPWLVLVPVSWPYGVYLLYPAVLAIPCGAAWGIVVWVIAVRPAGSVVEFGISHLSRDQ